jgi:hypothetical protein
MEAPEVRRAVVAAKLIAAGLDLPVDDAIVLSNSNKLALRLLPCEAMARVAPEGQSVAQLEIDVARQLAETNGPVAALEPRVAPRAYERDGFVVTFWTYYPPIRPDAISPNDYADALERLHAGMRTVDVAAPHFTDRVADAQRLVADSDRTPALANDDRALLDWALRNLADAIRDRGADEQLLHGEPHPRNVLITKTGLRFIDLETCCRGPLEFDLAHVPEAVSDRYPNVDRPLLRECRTLMLAMIATWRWDRDDQFPNGMERGIEQTNQLRERLERYRLDAGPGPY